MDTLSCLHLIQLCVQQSLPLELWRECIRWATLPLSGRLPLSDPPTCLSPWVPGCLTHGVFPEAPDFSYAYEQHEVYPTKRALMLVCKDWTELTTEFLYESILVDLYGIESSEKFVDVLQTPVRGSRLAWWVKRVDMDAKITVPVLTIQELCPNLRVFCMFVVGSNNQGHYLDCIPFLHPGSHLTTLSVTPMTLSAILEASPSILDRWRNLTIIIEDFATGSGAGTTTPVPILPPLPQLLSLTIVSFRWNGAASLVPISSWSCPLLTHLSIHFWNEFSDVIELVEHFGPQLAFFAFTLPESHIKWEILYPFLKAMPNLKGLVTPQISERITSDEQGPLREFRHPNIEVLGVPIPYQVRDRGAEYAQNAHVLFPNLRVIRITGAQTEHTAAYCRENPQKDKLKRLQSFAHILEGLGVILEDPTGEDVRNYILEGGRS